MTGGNEPYEAVAKRRLDGTTESSPGRRCTCDYYGPSEECALHGYCASKGHPPAGEWNGVVVCHCGDPVKDVAQ